MICLGGDNCQCAVSMLSRLRLIRVHRYLAEVTDTSWVLSREYVELMTCTLLFVIYEYIGTLID